MKFLKFLKNVYNKKICKNLMLLGMLLGLAIIFRYCIQNDETINTDGKRNITAQKDDSYDIEELYAYRDHQQIYGKMYRPKNSGEKIPVIIYSHGFGGTHEYGEDYAKEFVKMGYATYCFDFCGGSPSS